MRRARLPFNEFVITSRHDKHVRKGNVTYGTAKCVVCHREFTRRGPAHKSCSPVCAKQRTAWTRKYKQGRFPRDTPDAPWHGGLFDG